MTTSSLLLHACSNTIIISHNRNLTCHASSVTNSWTHHKHPFIIIPSNNFILFTHTCKPFTLFCSVAHNFTSTSPVDDLHFNSDVFPLSATSSWSEFASKVSGEWDGFGAEFTTEGKPIELPESVVPEAYREWEVKVYDWQTQCPTLANPEDLVLSYRLIKLLPTVGCEADAATIYNSNERNAGGFGSNILALAYQNTGCYVAIWPVEEHESYKVFELEHCLIDPRDKESRVRVIQILRREDMKLKLLKIRVFCEQWYGPFRNGDQLGGCAIRDSAFASTAALNVSDIAGVWRSQSALASYSNSLNKTFQELTGDSTQNTVRNEDDLITLPRQLWCSLKENGNGETCGEVGWLLDRGFAISSRCIFSGDAKLKEITLGCDTADIN